MMNEAALVEELLGDSAARLSRHLDGIVADVFVPRPRLSPSQWAEANLKLPRTTSSLPGDFRFFPPQRGIMDALAEPGVEELVVEKASRTGFTQLMAAMELFCIETEAKPVVSIHPKESSSRAFERKYIRPILQESEKLAHLFPNLDRQPWKSKISVSGSTLDFKDAVLPDNFSEYHAWRIFGDEVDRPQWNAGGEMTSEGDKITLMSKRLESFDDGMMILGSSPGTAKGSRIHRRFLMTDQRRYFMPCPHCGEFQYLEWGGRHTEYGVKWPKDQPEKAYYVCKPNGCVIEHSEKPAMLEKGEWRPTAKGLPGRVGFHFPALLSPFKRASWGRLAVEFVKATAEARLGNTELLQAFVNTSLGEVWEEPDAKKAADPHELQERLEMYAAEAPADTVVVLAGVDNQEGKEGQPGYSEVSFYAATTGEQLWLLGHFDVRTPEGLDSEEHWAAMEALLSRRWKLPNGREIPLAAAALDTGGNHGQNVMDFCNRMQRAGRRWWPIKGSSNPGAIRKPPLWPTSPSKSRFGGVLYVIDTYIVKDTLFDRLTRAPGLPGSLHFPTAPLPGSAPCDQVFFRRLTRERPKPLKGNPGMTTWENQPRDQEPWDCLVYAYAALHGLYAMKGGSKIRSALRAEAITVSGPVETAAPALPAPVPSDAPAPAAEAPVDYKNRGIEPKHDLPPPGTPPWKMTPEQRKAVEAARAAEEERARAKAGAVKGGRAPMRVSSNFVSN